MDSAATLVNRIVAKVARDMQGHLVQMAGRFIGSLEVTPPLNTHSMLPHPVNKPHPLHITSLSQHYIINTTHFINNNTPSPLNATLPSLTSSPKVIGKPAGLYRNIGEGVKEFFYEPYEGAMESPEVHLFSFFSFLKGKPSFYKTY